VNSALITPATNATVVGTRVTNPLAAGVEASNKQYQTGEVGMVAGIDTLMSSIQWRWTAGTAVPGASAQVVSATSTTITVSGFETSGTITAGTAFTVGTTSDGCLAVDPGTTNLVQDFLYNFV